MSLYFVLLFRKEAGVDITVRQEGFGFAWRWAAGIGVRCCWFCPIFKFHHFWELESVKLVSEYWDSLFVDFAADGFLSVK